MRIGEKQPPSKAVLQRECEEAEKSLNRQLDIARLKAHCSLLHGLPDRVVEELYSAWCYGGWSDLDNGAFYVKPPIERFTDHCIKLWAGGEEQ